MQPRVEGTIHLAHAAGIQRPQDAVRSELDARGHRGRSAVRHRGIEGRQRVDRGALGKRSGVGVRREQRLHFIPERDVVAARVAQERRALIRRTRQRRVEDLLDPRPAAGDRPS